MCPDEYKRLRTQRRKRESDALYNLRTKAEESAKQEEAAAVAAAAESSCTDYSTSNDIPNQNVSPEISVHSAVHVLKLSIFLCHKSPSPRHILWKSLLMYWHSFVLRYQYLIVIQSQISTIRVPLHN